MEAFLGTILPWSVPYEPEYTAFCNGQSLSVNQNQALYSLIVNTYGGTPNVNFNLPDLRGKVMVGATSMGGAAMNPAPTGNYNLGNTGGVETTTLTVANMPSHTHTANSNLSAAQGTVTGLAFQASGSLPVNTGSGSIDTPGGNSGYPSQIPDLSGAGASNTFYGAPTGGASMPVNVTVQATGTASVSITQGTVNTTLTNTGAGAAFSNLQPYIAMNFIIFLQGLYPTRQ